MVITFSIFFAKIRETYQYARDSNVQSIDIRMLNVRDKEVQSTEVTMLSLRDKDAKCKR